MQTSLLGLQASVGPAHIAVATSTYNFFMNMGGCIAIAVSQTIFNNQLKTKLGTDLANTVTSNPGGLQTIDNKDFVLDQVAASLGSVYYYTIPMAALIFFLTLFIEEYESDSKESLAIV